MFSSPKLKKTFFHARWSCRSCRHGVTKTAIWCKQLSKLQFVSLLQEITSCTAGALRLPMKGRTWNQTKPETYEARLDHLCTLLPKQKMPYMFSMQSKHPDRVIWCARSLLCKTLQYTSIMYFQDFHVLSVCHCITPPSLKSPSNSSDDAWFPHVQFEATTVKRVKWVKSQLNTCATWGIKNCWECLSSVEQKDDALVQLQQSPTNKCKCGWEISHKQSLIAHTLALQVPLPVGKCTRWGASLRWRTQIGKMMKHGLLNSAKLVALGAKHQPRPQACKI